MLKLLSNNNAILQVDDFYIVEKTTGLDELVFNISIHDENYPYVLEEAIVEYEQPYVVKAIDAGTSMAKVKCQLDLNELKADMKIGYSSISKTLVETVENILPHGWLFFDFSGSIMQKTIEGDYTPYEIIVECSNVYDVVFRYKPKERQIFAYNLKSFQPLGAFASHELNLKEINYKGKSTDFFTRLYAYGKDGLSFREINDGKEYVDNFIYSDKVICAVMRDEQYTTQESLLEIAKKQVETGGMPVRSYECAVYDLAKTNPEMYSFQDFSLFSVVKLIDDIKKTSINYQVVECQRYPNYPEKNVIKLSTTAIKIQNTVKNLKNEIENPQSSFRSSLQYTLNSLATSIAGYDGGNFIITHNTIGKPNGFMIMDTDSQDTANKVLWLNLHGITYSDEGVDGPYETVWSFEDGGFVADFIVTGTLSADRIKAGILSDSTGKNYWDLNEGKFVFEGNGLTIKSENLNLDEEGNLSVSGKYEVEYVRTIYAEDYTEEDVERMQQIAIHAIEPSEEDLVKYDFKGTGVDAQCILFVVRLVQGYDEWRTFKYKITIDPSQSTSLIKTKMTYWASSNETEYESGSIEVGGMGISAKEIFANKSVANSYATIKEDGYETYGSTGEFTLADGTKIVVTNGIITGIF